MLEPDTPEPRRFTIPIVRTTFRVTDRRAFEKLLDLCRRWIEQKHGKPTILPKDLAAEDHESPDARSVVRLLGDESGCIWTARVEDLREASRGRIWTTDVFIEKRGADPARFGVELVLPSTQREERFHFTRPRLVGDVLATLSVEADGVAMTAQPEVVGPREIETFLDLLSDPRRRLPILALACGDDGAAAVDPGEVARRMSGCVHLRVLHPEASWALTHARGKEWSVYHKAIRLYLPGADADDDPFRHPLWLHVERQAPEVVLQAIAARVLPAGFRSAPDDARFWRVGPLRKLAASTRSDATDIEILKTRIDQARRDQETAEALMEEAERAREIAEKERARLAAELQLVRAQLAQLPAGRAGSGAGPRDVAPLVEGPLTIADALRLVEVLFPDRIVVLPSAHHSAERSKSFRYPERTLDLLWKLAAHYWARLAGG